MIGSLTHISKAVLAAGFLAAAIGCSEAPTRVEAAVGIEEDGKEVVAIVGGVELTREMVLQAASSDLANLANQRREFEAKQKETRYQVLRVNLDTLIADRLLEREAAGRGLDVSRLVAEEVTAKTPPPTEKQIDDIYEANKSRLGTRTKEDVREDIVKFLSGQASQARRKEFLQELREKYQVEDRLSPLRYDVETAGHPSKGPDDARVELVEFSDFECPYCTEMNKALNAVTSQYEGRVKRVFRQFPISSIHPNAQRAAEASLCAKDQGLFWEIHARLFENPRRLDRQAIMDKATDIGIDIQKFQACLDSGRFRDQITKDRQAGVGLGVSGTPALFINGRPVRGLASEQQISQLVEEELDSKKR